MENPFKIEKSIILVDSKLDLIRGGDLTGGATCMDCSDISECDNCGHTSPSVCGNGFDFSGNDD